MNISKFTSAVVSTEACLIKNNGSRIITNLYEGIPETLILNLIAWVFFISLFIILRQQAWDYGRLALVNNHGENKRWTQLFYAHGNEDTQESTERNINQNQMIDRGFFSWIWVTLNLKKEQLLTHSGPDSVHYLSFQQHLMIVMGVITFISIVVILPVNFQGELSGDKNSFGHTTVSNLSPDSPWLWIHVIVAICYVPLVVLVMRKSSGRYAGKKASTRTIMATNIDRKDCEKNAIRTYIQQLFPDIQLTDIQLAYNISKLISVAADYEKIYDARIFCEFHKNHNPVHITTNCLKCETIDALEYYQEKERKLHGDVSRLKAAALNEPLGIAFVTVASTQEANNIIVHFRPGSSRRDGYRDWNLSFAPAPSDLFWENLSADTGSWYIKWFIVNLILFLFLFFLTTPVIIVNLLDTLKITGSKDQEISKISVLISEFLPTLLLLTLACIMPVIVGFSDKWLSHWTRSRQNYAIMTKSFGYLLFMILILPSLGLTSAQAFLEWSLQQDSKNETIRWECIFLPDKGAFFVNYVITAAFIGTALELIRFPELIMYTWQLCTAKSRAETPHIRKSILIEFPFGVHYAWTIMVFTMSTVYSLLCPLIMPFAMVYIGLKHFGDRHNLYFAYGPSNMISQGGGKIHSAAVTMTKISVILLLIIMAALATLRGGGFDPRAIVLIITLVVTLVLFTFMSPIKKCTTKPPRIAEHQGQSPLYIADVLLNKRIVPDSPTHLEYGSDSTVDVTISESELPIHVVPT